MDELYGVCAYVCQRAFSIWENNKEIKMLPKKLPLKFIITVIKASNTLSQHNHCDAWAPELELSLDQNMGDNSWCLRGDVISKDIELILGRWSNQILYSYCECFIAVIIQGSGFAERAVWAWDPVVWPWWLKYLVFAGSLAIAAWIVKMSVGGQVCLSRVSHKWQKPQHHAT